MLLGVVLLGDVDPGLQSGGETVRGKSLGEHGVEERATMHAARHEYRQSV